MKEKETKNMSKKLLHWHRGIVFCFIEKFCASENPVEKEFALEMLASLPEEDREIVHWYFGNLLDYMMKHKS